MSAFTIATRPQLNRYREVRDFTRAICEPLETEDYIVQSMPDVSPTRWHLAHTTWFFETFLLKPYGDNYQPRNTAFEYLFNSYYNAVGKQYPRSRRGVLTRPTVRQVWEYRDTVDQAVAHLLSSDRLAADPKFVQVVELGLQHEQQHQELMLTDIKHVLSCNPLFPAYQLSSDAHQIGDANQLSDTFPAQSNPSWCEYDGGLQQFGFAGDGFCFDNESPQFEQLLQDYSLQDRLITNREYLEFMQDQGYERPDHWLSMGWSTVEQEGWKAPLHWFEVDGEWHEFTLSGLQKLDLNQPVCHVSYFEADAIARWSGHRLPTELEWEHASGLLPIEGNFADSQHFQPIAATPLEDSQLPRQMFGDLWEWTSSQYSAYPGYQAPNGALGEYNGKFMCNQFVLRGGSCATSRSHIRPTYRNFFPPNARWQFTGIRFAS